MPQPPSPAALQHSGARRPRAIASSLDNRPRPAEASLHGAATTQRRAALPDDAAAEEQGGGAATASTARGATVAATDGDDDAPPPPPPRRSQSSNALLDAAAAAERRERLAEVGRADVAHTDLSSRTHQRVTAERLAEANSFEEDDADLYDDDELRGDDNEYRRWYDEGGAGDGYDDECFELGWEETARAADGDDDDDDAGGGTAPFLGGGSHHHHHGHGHHHHHHSRRRTSSGASERLAVALALRLGRLARWLGLVALEGDVLEQAVTPQW